MTMAEKIELACLLEATAAKPGNVHPRAAFSNLCWNDFLVSARITAPILAQTTPDNLGRIIRDAVAATHQHTETNTNLGIVLLIAPLVAVPEHQLVPVGIGPILDHLTKADAEFVYEAIRLADPGGLGSADEGDVAHKPTDTLRHMMALAADRDSIAAEYTWGYPTVLNRGVPILEASEDFPDNWERAVIRLHLELMTQVPDTFIARKSGPEIAQESACRARTVLDAGWPESSAGQSAIQELDEWLRADGNRRNPGTTADLVAASLFVAIREDRIVAPSLSQVIEYGRRLIEVQATKVR